MIKCPIASLAVLVTLAFAGGPAPAQEAGSEYPEEINTYRQAREERLRSDTGWLTLVDLHWLGEGTTRFGSGPANDMRLPAGSAPDEVGKLLLKGDQVSVWIRPGVEVLHDGESVRTMKLKTDASADPTVLELGSLTFHAIDREGQIGIRVKDKQSPVLASFRGLDFFPVSPGWRVEARFEPYDPPKKVMVPNVLGTAFEEEIPGRAVFEVAGTTYSLDAIGEPGGDLFMIFGDSTNGEATYPGGRYLYADPPENGRVVLDFNTAYNPPCVFTAFATCPLPPPGNRLALAIEAGEKTYAAKYH